MLKALCIGLVFRDEYLTVKMLRIIKLTTFFLLVTCLHVSAEGFTQRVTLSVKNATLNNVFNQIRKQTGFSFLMDEKDLKETKPVTANVKNASVEEVLDICLKNQHLSYKIIGKLIVISAPTALMPATSVSFLSSALSNITGHVLNEKGEPLSGVSVVIRGTQRGTTTNEEGAFKIDAEQGEVLEFSIISYKKVSITVGTNVNIRVVMEVEAASGEEVIVVGYGTQKRKNLTSSQASVKAADIQNIPNANLGSLLQGRASGVQITQNNGTPGAGTTVRIRGISSLRAGNDPLYVVDEVPIMGNLNDINPNDIESIDILKDAAAVAIYGARAANGVVLITTRRGKGKSKITLNTSYGIQNISKKLDVLEGPESLQLMKEMYDNTGTPRDAFFNQIDTTVNTNWSNLILHNNAPIRTIDVSANGGEGRIKYQTSLGYYSQDGIVYTSGFDRITGRLNLDVEVSKKLRFGNNLSIIHTKPQNIPDNSSTGAGVYLNAIVKNPLTPVYNAAGTGYNFVELYPGSTGNPLARIYETDRNIASNRAFGNIFAEYKILPNLSLRTSWGLDYRVGHNNSFNRSTSNLGAQTSGSFNNTEDSRWINTNTLTYSTTIAKDHEITILGVYEQQEDRNSSYSANASQFPNDKVITLNAAAKIDNASSSASGNGLASYLGRFTYSFKDKYIISGNIRRDGSSRFGLNNRWGTFPSVSAAWNVGDESFMESVKSVSSLKIRGSAGQVGNQNGLGNYSARGVYNTGADYAAAPGIQPGALPNPDLKWETTTQYNLGLDLGMLHERIAFTFDAYLKHTNDLLLDKIVPQSAGTGSVTVNLGKMENKGLEFNLTTRNLTGNFKWTTNFNIAFNQNKILELYGNSNDLVQVFAQSRVFNVNGLESLLIPGSPVGMIYGYVSDGIYSRNEDNKTGLRNQSKTGYLFQGGDVRYIDLNGDNVIGPSDRKAIGKPQPIHTGGMSNSFSYNGLSLDIFMNWSYGNQVYNATRQALTGMYTPGLNNLTEVRNRWRNQGDVTDIPRAGTGIAGNPNASPAATRFLEDGSYLRISNVMLSYRLPKSVIQKLSLDNARAFITGNNLALLTKYSGIDPDVRSFTGEGQYGIDFGAYPRARTFTVGFSLGF